MKIAIVVGRDPLIRTDTDGGSVFLEYLIHKLEERYDHIDIYIPSGVIGGVYSSSRAKQQQGTKKYGKHANLIYFPVPNQQSSIAQDQNYFLERIKRSEGFVNYFSDKKLYAYDIVCILHVSNAFALVSHDLSPLNKTVLFPMMTSENYKLFSDVPNAYVQHEQKTLQKIKHVCCPSDDEINKIRNKFDIPRTSLFKVHRGFEANDFPPHQRNKIPFDTPIRIISANGIRPQKDHLFLIRVAKELLHRKVPFQFLLTGNDGQSHNPKYNEYTQKFWKTVQENDLSSYFTPYDVVDRKKLVSLMNESHIAVYPSISETFGKSALESMATGLPTIVCDDIPAFKEFMTHEQTGYILSRDAIAWADAIERLREDAQLYNKISASGIALRSQFVWNKVMNDFVEKLTERHILK